MSDVTWPPKAKLYGNLLGRPACDTRLRPNGMLCNRRPKEHIGVHCDFLSTCENTSLRVRSDWRAGSMNATWRKAHTMGGLSRQVRNAAAKSRTSIQFSWAGPSGDLVDTLGPFLRNSESIPAPSTVSGPQFNRCNRIPVRKKLPWVVSYPGRSWRGQHFREY